MAHSLTKIWIHGVFSTKDRREIINKEFENKLYNHIRYILINKFHCYVQAINGTKNHIHILFLLNHNYSIQEIFHYIKGESSYWVNQMNFIKNKFAWQIGYGAFSIGESGLEIVEKYIMKQKEHHIIKSFDNEYKMFLKKYKIDYINP
jgi:putative transposase